MWPDLQEIADLVTSTEEILNGKLHFLFSEGNFASLLCLHRFSTSFSRSSIFWFLIIPTILSVILLVSFLNFSYNWFMYRSKSAISGSYAPPIVTLKLSPTFWSFTNFSTSHRLPLIPLTFAITSDWSDPISADWYESLFFMIFLLSWLVMI